MTGTLFLIPNTLGYNEGQQDGLLAKIIPDTVQSMSAQLSYFVAENAKTTRAYLKFLGQHHPLKLAMQDIQISELNVNTPAQALVLCRGGDLVEERAWRVISRLPVDAGGQCFLYGVINELVYGA